MQGRGYRWDDGRIGVGIANDVGTASEPLTQAATKEP